MSEDVECRTESTSSTALLQFLSDGFQGCEEETDQTDIINITAINTVWDSRSILCLISLQTHTVTGEEELVGHMTWHISHNPPIELCVFVSSTHTQVSVNVIA